MNELINGNAIKMTSIEIAELVGSRHDKVKQSIERLAARGVIRNPPMVVFEKINNLGLLRGVEAYVFEGEQGKRDSKGERHVIVNGVLMVTPGKKGRR